MRSGRAHLRSGLGGRTIRCLPNQGTDPRHSDRGNAEAAEEEHGTAQDAQEQAPRARRRARKSNEPVFDVREALHAILGVDLTQINGLGPSLALKLFGECGTNLTAWPSAKHFTSLLGLAPHNKISGGKVMSSKTRRTRNRAATMLRLVASAVGRTDTALGGFYIAGYRRG